MNWKSATLTELHTIAAWDEFDKCDVTTTDKWQATAELARRQQQTRKPYRVRQQKVRNAFPK